MSLTAPAEPSHSLRHQIRQALLREGFYAPVYLYETYVRGFCWSRFRRNLSYRLGGASDALPIPPGRLLWLVISSTDIQDYLESGLAHVNNLFLPLLERNGLPIDRFGTVLDFGCGCGRIMRYWSRLDGVKLFGTDLEPKAISWCRRHLGFAEFQVNNLKPPLSFESSAFDLVYARSVFTHLTEPLQDAWLGELHRVLRPSGHLLFTVSGDAYRDTMTPDEESRYDKHQHVVRSPEHVGYSDCAVWHPEDYVRTHWRRFGFEIVDLLRGRRLPYLYQDTYLARRSA